MDSLEHFTTLRIAIAALGEKGAAGWWESSFISESGVRFLSYAFPRASELAAVQGAIDAARRVHDSCIGTTGVAHLFRLPYEIELLLLDHLKSGGTDFSTRFSSLYSKPEACMASLQQIAGSPEGGHEGPRLIGELNGLPSDSMITRMASIYLGALDSGKRAFPYFSSAQ